MNANQELEQIAASADPFPVDFDQAWQWIGYTRKDTAKDALLRQFANSEDFTSFPVETGNGGRPSERIMLTVECFKSFCMMAGTEQGKKVRAYFIECERRLKAPQIDFLDHEATLVFALDQVRENKRLKAINAELTVTASAHEALTSAVGACYVADAGKVLGIGAQKFFSLLRKDAILQSTFAHRNVPYQEYIDAGYFIVKDRIVQMGDTTKISKTTFVTPKGESWLAKKYGKQFQLLTGDTE
jgi:phage antirepressor YoqD-like protein